MKNCIKIIKLIKLWNFQTIGGFDADMSQTECGENMVLKIKCFRGRCMSFCKCAPGFFVFTNKCEEQLGK